MTILPRKSYFHSEKVSAPQRKEKSDNFMTYKIAIDFSDNFFKVIGE